MALKLDDINQASKIMDVPIKNLKRWVVNGPQRKKGGRKTHDPQMEVKLFDWIKQFKEIYNELPPRKKIKEMAIKFSRFPRRFKASKGWYEKFMIRHFKKKEESDAKPWETIMSEMVKKRKLNDFKKIETKDDNGENVKIVLPKEEILEKVLNLWKCFQKRGSCHDLNLQINDFITQSFKKFNEKENKRENIYEESPKRYSGHGLSDIFKDKQEPKVKKNKLFARKIDPTFLSLLMNTSKVPAINPNYLSSVKSSQLKEEYMSMDNDLKLCQPSSLNSKNPHSIFVDNCAIKNELDSDKDKIKIKTESSLRKFKPNSLTIKSESLKIKSENIPESRTNGFPMRLNNLVAESDLEKEKNTAKTRKINLFHVQKVKNMKDVNDVKSDEKRSLEDLCSMGLKLESKK